MLLVTFSNSTAEAVTTLSGARDNLDVEPHLQLMNDSEGEMIARNEPNRISLLLIIVHRC